MWFLTLFLPDWLITYFVHIIFVVGLVATFAASIVTKLPFISNYGRLVQPIGMIVLAIGIFLEGSWWNERGWQAKIAELQEKVKVAEQKSTEANTKLDTALKEKSKVIKEKQVVIQEKIKEVQVKVNAECKISPDTVQIHNEATKIK
jgi:thiol:disulfide interchange protein